MMQVIFSKIELETLPFFDEKRVGKSHKKFQRGQHSEIYLLILKEQDKTQMELPLGMVSKHVFGTSICRTKCMLYLL